MKTSITKILDIDNGEITQDFINKLNYCEAFEDKKSEQHIFNSFDLLNDEDNFEGIFKGKNLDILREIEGLCVANECDYFRITY